MYRKIKPAKTSISRNTSYEGETIEQKVFRITNNKEPISDGAPIIFTERKDGVQPEYDIRTDRFDIAIEAMDKVTQTQRAKREERLKPIKGGKDEPGENKPSEDGGAKSTEATDQK